MGNIKLATTSVAIDASSKPLNLEVNNLKDTIRLMRNQKKTTVSEI